MSFLIGNFRIPIDFLLNIDPFKFKDEPMDFQWIWHGQKSYDQGLVLQKQALDKIKAGGPGTLLGMEHSTVLTLGLRSHQDPLMNQYQKIFSEVVKIRRGGHLVIHNPGQLVIYPVIDLQQKKIAVRVYLKWLVDCTKKFLLNYGIETFEKEEPGLFTHHGKIALFGVGVSRGVTQHGLCININNDLNLFKLISVCDVKGESMDQVLNYGHNKSLEEFFKSWCAEFEKSKPF